jgi:hypothetical protein
MMITVEQLQQVLTELPPLNRVKGEYYRVMVREYPPLTPWNGQMPPSDGGRFFEFVKRGHHWALASVPPF